ncbi:MAG: hypothetical protein PVG03_11990, partial [Desulfarculaceae bacterium]
ERPLKGPELLSRMKGWVTVDVNQANKIFSKYGRLKLLDDRMLVVECEDEEKMQSLADELNRAFADQVNLEKM